MDSTNNFRVEPYAAKGNADIKVINCTGDILLDGIIWHKHGQSVCSKLKLSRLQNNEVYHDRVSTSFICYEDGFCSDFAGDLWCLSFCDRNKKIWRSKSDIFVLTDAIRRSVRRDEDKEKDKTEEAHVEISPSGYTNTEYLDLLRAVTVLFKGQADEVKEYLNDKIKLLTNDSPWVIVEQEKIYKEKSDFFSKNGRVFYDYSDAYYQFDIDQKCITGLGYDRARIREEGKSVVIEIKRNDCGDFYLVMKNDGSDSSVQKKVDMIDVTTLPVDASLF